MREYTIYDISAMLGVCKETVRRWIRSGQLPASVITSRKDGYVISEQALFKFAKYKTKYLRRLEEAGYKIEPSVKEPYKVVLQKELDGLKAEVNRIYKHIYEIEFLLEEL